MVIVIGIDSGDPVYDCDAFRKDVVSMFAGYNVKIPPLFSAGYHGKICWIWEELAAFAVRHCGVDFFVLLGDDVELRSPGWKTNIEEEFRGIAHRRELPFGIGCVAFRDTSFNVFPTFPVMHRRHFDVFGRLFHPVFVNQHGDPFLFEVYRRWGASQFAESAELRNTVGGASAARYKKQDTSVPWRDEPLTEAINTLTAWLKHNYPGRKFAQCTCIDIVCPTHRCMLPMLRRIKDLRASERADVSMQILFVVDNPAATTLAEVRALEEWGDKGGTRVRVYVNEKNLGASKSRNAGMAQSFADYIICLDDDVIPSPQIVDAYVGAISRYPRAKAWVGSTFLPSPILPMEHAVIASGITFFYDVAQRMRYPPWGVTANICFRGRTQNEIWFSDCYPKTGGGEDVDYCLRLKANSYGERRNELIVGVPGARAEHPFWNNILTQVAGWASGDVLCLETHPVNTFYTLPNWIETAFALGFLSTLQGVGLGAFEISPLKAVQMIILMIVLEVLLLVCGLKLSSVPKRLYPCVAFLGVLPIMIQDLVRLKSKLARLKFYQLCLRFDWMDGQEDHVSTTVFNDAVKFILRVLVLVWFYGSGSVVVDWAIMIMSASWVLSRQSNWIYLCTPPASETAHFLSDSSSSTAPAKFVVLAFQRTGSNLLCGILHNHKKIAMHTELFHERNFYTYFDEAQWPPGFSKGARDRYPGVFLGTVYSEAAAEAFRKDIGVPIEAAGFKLFPEHLGDDKRYAALLKLLQDRRVKKVILHRRNTLAVYVSMLRAALTGKYLGSVLDDVLVKLSPAGLQKFRNAYEDTYAFWRSATAAPGQAVFELAYEDLVTDRDNQVSALLRFLEVSDEHVPKPIQETSRQSSGSPCDGVVNYPDIEYAFQNEGHTLFSEDRQSKKKL